MFIYHQTFMYKLF